MSTLALPSYPFDEPIPHAACGGRGCGDCDGEGVSLCQASDCPYVATTRGEYGTPYCAGHGLRKAS